jgi:hypothetical protein
MMPQVMSTVISVRRAGIFFDGVDGACCPMLMDWSGIIGPLGLIVLPDRPWRDPS